VLKIIVFEQELVLWRSLSGRVQLWDNRCPHRSVRLSIGKVEGEHLICAYHGWSFAANRARCIRIPAQPQQRLPQSLCAKAYVVAEAQGMIWFAGFEQQITTLDIDTKQTLHYAGSIMIYCSLQHISHGLSARSFTAGTPYLWHGQHQGWQLNCYISPTQQDKQQVHLLAQSQVSCGLGAEFLLQLRDQLELEHAIDALC
jgi:nitrite reductase/ring-hydroxylating ferredoxin subunit